jgi:protein-tyrosine phosphatase
MTDLVDLHTHILPGLDDGPENLEESVEMAQALHDLGFGHIFTTPHHRLNSWEGLESESVSAGINDLENALAERGLDIRFYPGFEYDFDDTLVQRARKRPEGAGHLLVDIGFWDVPNDLPGLLDGLKVLDVDVLLAHPERNGSLCRQPGMIPSLRESGIRFVGNLGSLAGLYGKTVRKDCLNLLRSDYYWAMASDLHSPEQVSWVRKGVKQLRKEKNETGMLDLLHNNPIRIAEDMMEENS